MDERQRNSLFSKLLLAFAISFLMSNGPGVLLVNKPSLVAGMPLLYLWALAWGIVQIGIVLYAYFKLWRHEVEEEIQQAQDKTSGEGS